jgi:hypothetical protein
MKRALLGTAGGVLCLVLPGCGGSSSNTSTPTPVATPQPCVQSVVFQGQGQIPSFLVDREPFVTTTSGRVDVILDWTQLDSPMAVYVVPSGTCTIPELNAHSCNFLIRSEPSAAMKPLKVSAPSVAPGAYDLLVGNASSKTESVSTQVISSTTTCPAIATRGNGDGALGADGSHSTDFVWR